MFDDDDSVFAAMRAGARGYLLKGADKEEMRLAIRAVAGGEAIFGPAIAHRLMRYFAAPTPAMQSAPPQVFPGLTDREREILTLIAGGQNNQEIANEKFLSLKTVRNYVSNIYSKLQVTDRAQAIVRAREAGLARDRESG
jgi:DNA-binding NarL/FixJ family response regulator